MAEELVFTWPDCNCRVADGHRRLIATAGGRTVLDICQNLLWLRAVILERGEQPGPRRFSWEFSLAEPSAAWRAAVAAPDEAEAAGAGAAERGEMNWTHPLCEGCFAAREPGRRAVVMSEADRGAPVNCCSCGQLTRAGIWYRADPRQIPFPYQEPADEDAEAGGKAFEAVMREWHGERWELTLLKLRQESRLRYGAEIDRGFAEAERRLKASKDE